MNVTRMTLKHNENRELRRSGGKNKRRRAEANNPLIVILCKIIVYIVYGKFSEHFRWAYVFLSIFGIIAVIGGVEKDTISLTKGLAVCIFFTVTAFPAIISLVRKYEDQ